MIDRSNGEVWFLRRPSYRNFATKSQLPLGPILRLFPCDGYGWVCDYRPYYMYIRQANKRKKLK